VSEGGWLHCSIQTGFSLTLHFLAAASLVRDMVRDEVFFFQAGWWSQIPYGSNQTSLCQVSVYVREEVVYTVRQYDNSLKFFDNSPSSCNEKRSLASVICRFEEEKMKPVS